MLIYAILLIIPIFKLKNLVLVMKIILRYQVGKLGTVLYSVANFISYITYCEIFSEHEFYDLSLLLYKHMIKCIWKIFNEVIQKEKGV